MLVYANVVAYDIRMEQLNKQQIILLALLVSFVSSIATGIVTVSLMQQDQPTAVQTINRIVERTIEKASDDASAVTKETIVVKDDEAVPNAVSAVSRSVARIYTSDGGTPLSFVGIGLIVTSSGRIVSSSVIPQGVPLIARLEGGNVVPLTYIARDRDRGLSLLQADQSSSPADMRTYTPAALSVSANVKLGQSVVAIGGSVSPVVATGIVSSVSATAGSGPLKASMDGSGFDALSVLANLLGEVVGIQSDSMTEKAFIPADIIKTYATL